MLLLVVVVATGSSRGRGVLGLLFGYSDIVQICNEFVRVCSAEVLGLNTFRARLVSVADTDTLERVQVYLYLT